ncbi:MAG: DoxX family protein [Thermaerobacter sp.]|nr:DoxX family protein [Thermaerobacter sp.]
MVSGTTKSRVHVDMPAGWLAFWRIGFGLIWLVDAWFKWQPSFVNGFVGYLSGSVSSSQPGVVNTWIRLWVSIIQTNPHLWAYLVALGETVIALALILGVGTRLTAVVGGVLALIIWTTAEGFGGPYGAGATDVGAAIMYIGGFALLALTQAGYAYGLDGVYHLTGWSWRKAHEVNAMQEMRQARA